MTEPTVNDDLIAAHGITPDEYASIIRILNREPSFTELGIFSAMWNEHCSYKSSKKMASDPANDRPTSHLRPR